MNDITPIPYVNTPLMICFNINFFYVVHSPCDITLPLIVHSMIEVEVTVNFLVVVRFGRCTGSQLPGIILQTVFNV